MAINLFQRGRLDYVPTYEAMQAFTANRTPDTPNELWLCEHPPVFTQGLAGKADHLLLPGDIPVVQTNRGGQVTYHGPGQLVAYPMVDLRRLGVGVRELVCRIESAVIDVLAGFGVHGERRDGAPGIYVDGRKVMALGLRVRRGCTFHGLAFNIAMDLEPFRRINPCGYQGLEVTSVLELGGPGDFATIQPVLVEALSRRLGLAPEADQAITALLQRFGVRIDQLDAVHFSHHPRAFVQVERDPERQRAAEQAREAGLLAPGRPFVVLAACTEVPEIVRTLKVGGSPEMRALLAQASVADPMGITQAHVARLDAGTPLGSGL